MPTVKPSSIEEPELPQGPLSPDLLKRVFRARVLKLLALRDWTQAELGRRAGIPRDFISTYLRDPPRSMPTQVNIIKIAHALGVKTSELVPQMGDVTNVVMPLETVGSEETGMRVRINIPIPFWAFNELTNLIHRVQRGEGPTS